MKCLHCLVEFHDNEEIYPIGKDADKAWAISSYRCPSCERLNLFLVNAEVADYGQRGGYVRERISTAAIRPKGSLRPPCPLEVPRSIAEDYNEACLVLPDSPKASAALSRRCLQNILRQAANVKPSNLDNEIQQVLDNGHLPTHLAQVIDAVRQIGNFAAHPLKSQSTGEIVPVEPEETAWNLDVIEALFDFYYVQPSIIAKKREALNAKLQDAGKKPLK